RYSYVGGQRRLLPAGRSGSTNDLGQFRIFGLPPGEYFISATLRSMVVQGEGDTGMGYAPTYYPGVSDVGGAQRVAIASGQELAGLTFALQPTRTARLSGTVADSAGRPLANAMIMVVQTTESMMTSSMGAQVKPDGTFSISNLAPGQYTLSVRPVGQSTGEEEVANVPLTVAGDDITNLRIVTSRGATLSGNVVFAPGTAGALVPSTVQVSGTSAEPGMVFGGTGMNRVGDDWTFTLKGLAGRRLIRVAGLPPRWWLQAVRLNGTDVTDHPIEFRANQTVTGVEIVLSDRPTRITGTVTDERGRAAIDYTTIVFANDKSRWGYATRYVTIARPDQNGAFLVEKLPPGEYRAIAVEAIEEGEWMDPELLERLQPAASRFSLGDGQNKALMLKVTAIR
ncbi:MAG: carboxypeptidase regulatory-like domain-containing protein, partial [Acidobacteria bacterium]|nr:carboxypeptidase regulatory-like domain-containing protein [Acidobacteriota bacterium]